MIFKNQTYKDIRSCNIGHYRIFPSLQDLKARLQTCEAPQGIEGA